MAEDQFSFERVSNACVVALHIPMHDLKKKADLEYKSPIYRFNSTHRWGIELQLYPQADIYGKYHCKLLFRLNRSNVIRCYTYQIVMSKNGEPSYEFHGAKFRCISNRSAEMKLQFFNIADIIKNVGYGNFIKIRFDVSFISCMIAEKNESNKVFLRSLNMYSFTLNGKFSDVTIKTTGREFRAHRLILAARSPVFYAMLSNEMKEADTGVISINDVRPEVMQAMLYYIYNDKAPNLPEVVFELFNVAHLYDMKELQNKCKDYLESNLKADIVTPTLKLAEKYELEALTYSAQCFVDENESDMVKHESYIEYLLERLNVHNVAEYLLKADKYKLLKFKDSVMNFINSNFKEVIENPEYKELYKTHAHLILSVDQYLSTVRN